MKIAFFVLAFISILPLSQAEEALPTSVQKVMDQRAAAIAKIDTAYVQELEKLKVTFTKQGNLDVANKIVELIKNAQGGILSNTLKGKWIYQLDVPGDTRKFNREFDDTHMIDQTGRRCPYTVKGDIVRIHFGAVGSRFFEDITINPMNHDVIRGVNNSGTKFTYTRDK